MKIKIDWKALGKALWSAVKPVLLAAIGGGIVTVAGMLGAHPAPRGQTTEVVAFGVPAIAWVSHTTQNAEHNGGDTNGVSQTNPVTTVVPISAK